MKIFVQIHPVSGNQLPQSFESIAEILISIPGMFFEMDGSFVWVDHGVKPTSQMDGMVYDRQDKLAYIEIKGACSSKQWLTLCLAACGLATQTSRDQISNEEKSQYLAIDRIARVHRVVEGDWTTASTIANQL
jgi:hypothetical protein